MTDHSPYSLIHVRELGHGIHDLPGFDTTYFRLFAFRLDPNETRLPIDRTAETLLLVIEGNSPSPGTKQPACRPSSGKATPR